MAPQGVILSSLKHHLFMLQSYVYNQIRFKHFSTFYFFEIMITIVLFAVIYQFQPLIPIEQEFAVT